jgi:4-amino-4-deoxychorismate lyase
MTALLINGAPPADSSFAIAATDRGLNYGDGLFETMLYRGGSVCYLDAHLRRLREGCQRLGIVGLDETRLREDIHRVCGGASEGVVKIVITREGVGRGYRPISDLCGTRIVSLHSVPPPALRTTVNLRWCEIRLGRNAALAGMKHLNRLEQVLAQREWNPAVTDEEAIDEGLLLDSEGELICATMSNVFIVRDGTIATPDLRFCGVRGVMRGEVLRIAGELGIATSETALWPRDVETATEVFITNVVRGIRGVAALGSQRWPVGPVTRSIAAAVSKQ